MYRDRTWRPRRSRRRRSCKPLQRPSRQYRQRPNPIPPAAESTIPPAAESMTAKATRVTIAKDPKKVSAGLKGAAAKKAKQKAVLEQLRKAKDDLRAGPQEPAAAEAATPPANPTSSLWPYAVFAGAAALAFFAITPKNVPAVEKKQLY